MAHNLLPYTKYAARMKMSARQVTVPNHTDRRIIALNEQHNGEGGWGTFLWANCIAK